jgi:hypothetical protein
LVVASIRSWGWLPAPTHNTHLWKAPVRGPRRRSERAGLRALNRPGVRCSFPLLEGYGSCSS